MVSGFSVKVHFCILVLFNILFINPSLAYMGKCWKSDWSECSSNSDCAKISGICGWPTAVNKKYSSSAYVEECIRSRSAEVDCIGNDPKQNGLFKAECINGVCEAKEMKE